MKAMTLRALAEVIERHKLKPDKRGEFHLTKAMIAEAMALDDERGEVIPEWVTRKVN